MSARIVPRAALRQTRFAVQRRAESTTAKATEAASSGAAKAQQGASEAAGKAQQGLSRVSSSAGNAVSGAASAASKAVSGIGGRTGQIISFAQSMVPPTIYYAKVAGELAKIVYKGRNMQVPNMQTVQSYMTPVQNAIRNPSSLMNRTTQTAQSAAQQTAQTASNTAQTAVNNPETALSQLRNFDTAALTSAGVILAETIGFFTIGTMIGRMKIVGYRGEVGEHH